MLTHTSNPRTGDLMQKDHKFKVSLGYIVTLLKNQNQTKTIKKRIAQQGTCYSGSHCTLAAWEAEIRKITIQVQPRQIVRETPS
jgi:hypothetical protein